MMNYVATQLVAYFCIFWESPKGSGKIGIINQKTQIGWLPKIAGQQYMLNIIVVLVLCGGKVSGIIPGRGADKREIGMMMTRVGGTDHE